jgi:hypothetical protein
VDSQITEAGGLQQPLCLAAVKVKIKINYDLRKKLTILFF